ncbi:hypothetical protein HH214_11360 [Mucilaginibacter robiniae]|uniref:Lmo0937 family membrane protein n=1 Tax=Mucilaginibacter robiniae TaxID=2728022 RepID=A0A7L5E400_9SPHI|nr:hypothetical protein [Mucilaginibacter robiniae]QJD96424.1 hypothetical protein HH214_11360 [Mucilaginibacter robiniae]
MKALFFLAAAVSIIIWGISVFAYGATDLIHSLIAFAVIFVMMGVMKPEQATLSAAQKQVF